MTGAAGRSLALAPPARLDYQQQTGAPTRPPLAALAALESLMNHLVVARRRLSHLALVGALGLASASGLVACSEPRTPADLRSDVTQKWYERALQSYQAADFEEAGDAAQKAIAGASADDKDVAVLAGTIALARLDYAEVLRLLKNTQGSAAAGLRGRALWYQGKLDEAADELEAMLNDPEVVDPWAKAIAKLARQGAGRVPFAISGGLLAAVEMVPVNPQTPVFVVPIEIDGEAVLALVTTTSPELMLDSATRREPSWVSLRFAETLEVHDVPSLVTDLSGVAKTIGVPIRATIGMNLLRHLNTTIDFEGRQFVVRSFEPPAPPDATRLRVGYVKGGGIVFPASLGDAVASLSFDSSMIPPIELDQAGWKKAGVDYASLTSMASAESPDSKLRSGELALLKLGALDIPKVPGIFGGSLAAFEKGLGYDLDGVLGAGLLGHYRLTFGESGRVLWIEDHAMIDRALFGDRPRDHEADDAPPEPEPADTAAPSKPAASTKTK